MSNKVRWHWKRTISYFDKKSKIYILLWPGYNPNNLLHRVFAQGSSIFIKARYGKGLTLRIVKNFEDMMEKIKIFDTGLYDIYVEIVKEKYKTFLKRGNTHSLNSGKLKRIYYDYDYVQRKPMVKMEIERDTEPIIIPWSQYEYDLIAKDSKMNMIREYDGDLELINIGWIYILYNLRVNTYK